MSNPIEVALAKMTSIESDLREALKIGPNESDTRLKVLDRILFEVLEWKHEAVFTEPPTESGYIDYLLTVGEKRSALVVEAKRAGRLKSPSKSEKPTNVSLLGPITKPFEPGIRQAKSYASENGVAVAVVTDGESWLFFRASRTDGKKPLDGKGIFFPSMSSVMENFARFYELLSPTAVLDRRQLAHLVEAEGLTVGDTEQHYYVFKPAEAKMRKRDPLANDAALLFGQFFSRLSNDQDREMLRDCFVETHESRKADLELQKIIQKILNNVATVDTGSGGELQVQLERAIQSGRSETILLIGNKGSGKSTFVDRFFDQTLPLNVRQRCAVARIDLGNYHGDKDGIVSWAILQLREQLEPLVCDNNPPSYEDLLGIFFQEYQRWSTGFKRPLYEQDKTQFKIEFGAHMEDRREKHPDDYVRKILDWSSRGQKKLPCLIFDNTDQFSMEVQDAVYQLAHSLEGAAVVFNVVPITDRTVWRLSKAGALQSYTARSFYLPVPDAKEIISRRVEFLKQKLKAAPKKASAYFSNKGFSVEIGDIAALSDTVGAIFVDNDYVSGLIGRLGNFDIRRMLKLAERIFLSPELKIDDIVRSKFGGRSVTADKYRTHRALVKGEYDRFSETENEFVSNLFSTNHQLPESPLLAFYILWVLRQRMNSVRDDGVEAKHWLIVELCEFFEPCGVAEELVLQSVRRLYERRLIEAFDPNLKEVGIADKITIKDSGVAHIELMLQSTVYVEQAALVTGINEIAVRDEIKQRVHQGAFVELRDNFLKYILKVDATRISIPTTPNYRQLSEARKQIKALCAAERTPRKRMRFEGGGQRGSNFRTKR